MGKKVSLHTRNTIGKAPVHAKMAHEGVEVNLPSFLVSTLDGGLSALHSRCSFPQRKPSEIPGQEQGRPKPKTSSEYAVCC
jgi:hypothetical protein